MITPLQTDVRGLTGRHIDVVDTRDVSHNSWTTLAEIAIHPTEDCDLLVMGHIAVTQSGQRAREAVIDIRVMLDNDVIGEGRAVTGIAPDNGNARQSSGFVAAARNVPPGTHTLRVQGIASSTTGAPTVRASHVSVGVVEFYR